MPLHHVSLPTGQKHYKQMRDFYLTALAPFGYSIFMEKDGNFLGLQTRGAGPDFWLHCGGVDLPGAQPAMADDQQGARGTAHIAFTARSRGQVDRWYQGAIKAGGIPNGTPGERTYVSGYYAAYVLDPMGNNVEAVYYNPWWLQALTAMPWLAAMVAGGGVALGYAKTFGWM